MQSACHSFTTTLLQYDHFLRLLRHARRRAAHTDQRLQWGGCMQQAAVHRGALNEGLMLSTWPTGATTAPPLPRLTLLPTSDPYRKARQLAHCRRCRSHGRFLTEAV